MDFQPEGFISEMSPLSASYPGIISCVRQAKATPQRPYAELDKVRLKCFLEFLFPVFLLTEEYSVPVHVLDRHGHLSPVFIFNVII